MVLKTIGTPKSQKDEQLQALKQEVTRLRKFLNERQQEIFDLRKHAAVFYKKQKEAQDKIETQLKRQYKDNLTA